MIDTKNNIIVLENLLKETKLGSDDRCERLLWVSFYTYWLGLEYNLD